MTEAVLLSERAHHRKQYSCCLMEQLASRCGSLGIFACSQGWDARDFSAGLTSVWWQLQFCEADENQQPKRTCLFMKWLLWDHIPGSATCLGR